MKALLRRLVNGIGRLVDRRQARTPVERLVTMILLNAKKNGVKQIVIEYRQDGDSNTWPAERPSPPLDEEMQEKLDAEFDDEYGDQEFDFEDAEHGAVGVLYYPSNDDEPYCEMRPPVLLWSAIREWLLYLANIDPERCQRYRNGYRYHGQCAEKIVGDFHLDSDGYPLAEYSVRYEVDYDAERVVLVCD